MQRAIGRMRREARHRTQTVALTQERQGFKHHRAGAAHSGKESVRIRAKSAATSRTVEALLNITEDLDVVCLDFAEVGTVLVATPLPLELHDVSPPLKQMIRPIVFHGLRIHSMVFTAYRYSTQNLPRP